MSDILIKIGSIAGESTVTGYENQIECVSMRHVLDLPLVSGNKIRVEGTSRHGAVELEHLPDLASPGLRLAVSGGQNLGEVSITRLKMIGGVLRPVESIVLSSTYVVRVDLETPLNSETARPADEPLESFALEYADMSWSIKQFENGNEVGQIEANIGAGKTMS